MLEPLRREETPFLRLVADAAAMARDIGPGAACMADFWHMAREETSAEGAILSGGALLRHVHIASLRTRRVPGDDEGDTYLDGFRALRRIGYAGSIAFEGSFDKTCATLAARDARLTRMSALLREEWQKATP